MSDAPSPPPRKPRVWPLAAAYAGLWGLHVLFAALLAAAAAAVFRADVGRPPSQAELARAVEALLASPWLTLLSALLLSLVLIALPLLAGRLSPVPLRERVALVRPAFSPGRRLRGYVVATALVLALGFATSTALSLIFGDLSPGLEAFDEAVRVAPPPLFTGLVLLVAVLAPLGEELFFRGYMQTRLTGRFGRWPGIAVTALLFGALHLDLMHAAFASLLGLGLGWITVACGSVWPAVVAHAANNLLALLGARVGAAEPAGAPGLLFVLLSLGLVALLARSYRRSLAGAPTDDEEPERGQRLPVEGLARWS